MTNVTAFPQVRDFLRKCNLSQYYDRFISEGFDQLQFERTEIFEELLDVTEYDLIAMDVKRGHRRRLQREIASMKGVPQNMPLYIQHGTVLEDSCALADHNASQKIPYVNGTSNSSGATVVSPQIRSRSTRDDDPQDPPDSTEGGSTKRKYKRHPKRDKNAPVKPLSAYVMFAHKVREEYAGQNISFPEMAKIVGDRLKTVSPEVKEAIENEAAKAKEEYQAAMAVYKTTDYWKAQFFIAARDSSKSRKRQNIEPSPDSDNATPSGYSSTRSTSVGYENGSGNISSGSSNGNGNGQHSKHQFLPSSYSNHGYQQHHPNYPPHSSSYIPPYTHYNPSMPPFGYTNNSIGQNVSSTFVTPPSSNSNGTPSTTLADFTRQVFEDSDNSTSSSNTPPAAFVETEENQSSKQAQKKTRTDR
ncbi:14936_t:CDS:2 [Funneliformis mosseae]|uniref:14936_t:CDS:1 n=1 Tax=Funneliformis mosseae TaxID=27381 RepID=A0A9N8YS02_FUNMO|nr:14936_t:CDS:2 [Funneliformis mosseae]